MNRLAWSLLSISALCAQGTREDYARAAKFTSRDPLVFEAQISPVWLENQNRFWYWRNAPEGSEFIRFDVATGRRTSGFDHEKLAAALSRATGKPHPARRLSRYNFDLLEKDNAVRVQIDGTALQCSLDSYECRPAPARPEQRSPDGKWVVFQKNHNLYVRSTATNEEIQLTSDGGERCDYSASLPPLTAKIREGSQQVEVPPSARWSPDSKKLLAYRLDRRSARQFTVVQSVPKIGLRPVSYTYDYPLPGEIGLSRAEPVILDVLARKRIDVKTEPLELLYIGGPNLRWSKDSRHAYFLYSRRGYQNVQLREIDAETGDVRVLVDERSETFVDPGMTYYRVLEGTSEVIWSSQRDGWCHLYLYDAASGRVKNQITKGSWAVRSILRVDEKRRRVWFSAGGRESGRDPYLVHAYAVNFDGAGLRLLTPEDAEHRLDFSPTGEFFVDTYSKVNTAPVSVLRRAEDGAVAAELERADVEPLWKTGWTWPEPFRVVAADGTTDIYGVLYRPSNFNSAKKYPVIESIYTGPQAFTAPKAFRAASQQQALAELGFIVVVIDGRGMAKRSKAFHDFAYKNLGGDVRLADHIAGIKQLAQRYPYLDLTRVGVYGHSAGGYDAANAILTHPEFYKVAVSSAGNHDHRMDKAWWNELWMGFPLGDHYVQQSNVTLAPKLQGKLLLAHGELDDNVHPSSTLQLVDALIKANKDFDLLLMPGQNHGMGGHPYFVRRRWDYFVRHLLGVDPPKEYPLGDSQGGGRPSG